MERLNWAYAILVDPEKRRQYDNTQTHSGQASVDDWLNRQADSYGARFSDMLFARLSVEIADALFASLFGDIEERR